MKFLKENIVGDCMKIAAIQAEPIDGLFSEKNLAHSLDLLRKASRRGANVACFPDGYPSAGEEEICREARDLNIVVIASFVGQKDDGTRYDEILVINTNGEIVCRQSKILLYWSFEPDFLKQGTEYNIISTKWGNIGILKCWEIGFPEAAYRMVLSGVDIIFNPAHWMSNLLELWHSILFVRCFENHVPIVAVNSAKWKKVDFIYKYKDKKLSPSYGGKSVIVLPENISSLEEGTLRSYSDEVYFNRETMFKAEAGDGEEILFYDIDLASFRKVRQDFLKNRSQSVERFRRVKI